MSVSRTYLLDVGVRETEGEMLVGFRDGQTWQPFTQEPWLLGLTTGAVPLTGQRICHLASVQ